MNRTLVWAHRGASGYAPENTLVAFQKAIELGADGIELDVQMTKDGELVIIHDETVKRVSNAKGWVKDYTFEEIRKLNVNKKFPEYGEVVIPTLEEVYSLMLDTDLTINVELKNGIVFYDNLEESIIELTKRMGLWERVTFSSFNHYSVMKLKKLDPFTQVGFLYEDGYIDMPDYALKHGVCALHPALYNLQYPDLIRDCKDKGIAIRTWTVNGIEEMRMLCENRIDAIITNYPDIARKVVDEYEERN
ncbi:MAG TPA: glycerophosphodiester phosphodiesterase [Lachnospiraceae bacterium]|nr:glycerophosphodiester phosphodiesterase [Lachnospiraceae bacterium]